MTDPGSFTYPFASDVPMVSVVIITHEHGDHIHVPAVRELVQTNPNLTIVTNSSVAALLKQEGIEATVLEGTNSMTVAGVHLEAFDARHAEIFEEVGQVQNTGYFITERLFYPGDAYAEPAKPVEVLALPVGGPWCRITDTLHYALRVQPKVAFPIHDSIEREDRVGVHHGMAKRILEERGISFVGLRAGEEHTF